MHRAPALVAAATILMSASNVTAQTAHEVIGKSGPNVWEWRGTVSKPGTVGNPNRQLQVRVRNGDTVFFITKSGSHAVILENATTEMGSVWEIVAGTGSLLELPNDPAYQYFDRAKARRSKASTGNLIQIRITNLKPGLANAILFACDPHSRGGNGTGRDMLGAIVLAEDEKTEDTHQKTMSAFLKNPPSQACRVISFDKAVARPGIANNTYILIVNGTKPCINMEVRLVPYVYVQQPDYWQIEVVACLPGAICLTAVAPFTEALPLDGIIGKKGIEVIGANMSLRIDVPPKSPKKSATAPPAKHGGFGPDQDPLAGTRSYSGSDYVISPCLGRKLTWLRR